MFCAGGSGRLHHLSERKHDNQSMIMSINNCHKPFSQSIRRQSLSFLMDINALSCIVLSCLVLFCLVWFVLSCLILSCLILSCLVLTGSALSGIVLSCLILSCLVLACIVMSCLVLSSVVFDPKIGCTTDNLIPSALP